MNPAWLDPHYLGPIRLRQMQAHEDEIRRLERERERRRALATLNTSGRASDDFEGCVE